MINSWQCNDEHDQLYDLSCSLTEYIQCEFGDGIRVECGYEERVGYHFRLHGVEDIMSGKVSDSARDWLAANTPFRFELACDML